MTCSIGLFTRTSHLYSSIFGSVFHKLQSNSQGADHPLWLLAQDTTHIMKTLVNYKLLGALTLLLLWGGNAFSSILYVNPAATGANNGTSWTNAYTNLQTAFGNATLNDEIWIVAGTYYPGSARGDYFNHPKGVKVYGGFSGSESSISERDWWTNKTVLSGAIGTTSITDNCYNVYTIQSSNRHADNLLDGVVISGGYANNVLGSNSVGAGLKIKTTWNTSAVYSIEVRNTVFENNESQHKGGGVFQGTWDISVFTNCIFRDNTADWGGGLFTDQHGKITLTNCSFNNNEGISRGRSIYHNTSSIFTYQNSIIWGGAGAAAEEVYSLSGQITIENSILPNPWLGGSTPLSYSTTNEIHADPEYANADLDLSYSSPALNAGNASLISLTKDVQATNRIKDGIIDIGATEFQHCIVYIDKDATGLSNGTSWTDAYSNLSYGLNQVTEGCQVWVAEGTYYAGTARGNHLKHPNGAQVYGGFDGTETELNQRDWWNHKTIFSGDIGVANDNSDNTYNIYDVKDKHPNNLLDGVVLSDGNANGPAHWNKAGALLIRYPNQSGFAIEVRNTVFENNTAQDVGGAVFVGYQMEVVFSNCIFRENSTRFGGAIFVDKYAAVKSVNSSFNANNATVRGRSIYLNNEASMNFKNSIVWGGTGAATYEVYGKTPYVDNAYNVLPSAWLGGTTPLYYSSTNEVNLDPLFANADLELSSGSPALNSGDNGVAPWYMDIKATDRIQNTTIDMGAHESGTYKKGAPTGILDTEGLPFSVFPNPALEGSSVTVSLEGTGPKTMSIYTSTGQLVRQENLPVAASAHQLSNLARGSYWVEVTGTSATYRQLLIIQ